MKKNNSKDKGMNMRAISFKLFKENCTHAKYNYDCDKAMCLHESNNTVKTGTCLGGRFQYNPCAEKYCPVLSLCPEINTNSGNKKKRLI